MATILYVESSPRKLRSSSIAVSRVFLDRYQHAHPSDRVETLDLWEADLLRFDGEVLDAKYAIIGGKTHTSNQARVWREVQNWFERFKNADKYVFSVPMWNFGTPYVLKHYIDIITQPGMAFSFSPEAGYAGLVTGRPAAVIYSAGGDYRPGSGAESMDLRKSYMETWLGFIGFEGIRSIVVEPTLGDPAVVQKAMNEAKMAAIELAENF